MPDLGSPVLTLRRQALGFAPVHPRGLPRPRIPDALPAGEAPTITLSAANVGSAITGSTRRAPAGDPTFTALGRELRSATLGGYTSSLESIPMTGTNVNPPVFMIEFETDADKLELGMQCATTNFLRYRLWIDDKPVAWAPVQPASSAGAAFYRLLVDWTTASVNPGRRRRRVRLQADQARFTGVWAHPTVTLWRSARPVGPTIAALGDSFGEGTGAAWGWDAWPEWLALELGWNIVRMAVGATGYVAAPAGKMNYADRVAADLPSETYGVDGVLLSGGWNDLGAYVESTFTAKVDQLYANLAAARPGLPVIAMGPFSPVAMSTSGVQVQARDVLRARAAANGAVTFIDPIVYPAAFDPISGPQWTTGNVSGTRPNGSGNADYLVSSDNIHPTAEGHVYLGARTAAAVIAAGLA